MRFEELRKESYKLNTNKRGFEWPAYSTWWDRNEKKVNIVLWIIFIVLLIIARVLVTREIINLRVAMIWGVVFFIDVFILSFITTR